MYRRGCPATRRRSGPSSSMTGKRVPCCRPCVAPTWPVPLPVSVWTETDGAQILKVESRHAPRPQRSARTAEASFMKRSSTGFCNDRLTPSLFNIVGRCLVAMAHFERTTCTARQRAKGLLFLPVCGRPRRYARHDSYCSDRENPCR
jgi:hypothetical protein